MDGVACKLPGIISPLLNRATEAATPPHTHHPKRDTDS